MTTPDKCPYCGAESAELAPTIYWSCDTYKWNVKERGKQCYDRQIERLTAALNGVLDTLSQHDAIAYDCDRSGNTYCNCIERVTKKAREALNPGGAS